MAEVEKNSLQQLIDWIFSWKEPFEWLRQRIGLLLTVVVILSAVAVVAAVYTWRN
jgi:cell division protein FtsL